MNSHFALEPVSRELSPLSPRDARRVQLKPRAGSTDWVTSTLLVAMLTGTVVLGLLVFLPEMLHWFLLPVMLCGILIGTEAMEWLRGRTDLFDVAGLVSLLGFHFFFVAPLLMIALDWRMKYLPDQPADYRPWLGVAASINVVGLVVYRTVRHLMLRRTKARAVRPAKVREWTIEPVRFWVVLAAMVLVGLCSQAYIFASLGGISGYINSYTAALSGQDQFAGAGWLYLAGESVPILLGLGFAVWARKGSRSLTLMLAVMLTLGVLEFLIGGGLRGSRSSVIWNLFWITGMLHGYVRKVPRTVAYGAILVLYLFVSVYAAYKQRGADLFNAFASSGDYSALNETAEGPATVLVGDFSRADVQSYLVYKLWNETGPEPAWGATYLGAATMLVPRVLWPERPPTILKWTTDAEYGRNAFESGMMKSSRVYGIAGEAMLNFGTLGALLAYAVFGVLVAGLQLFLERLPAGDSRWLVTPLLINSLFVLLLNDSDNVVFFLIKSGLLPLLLVVCCSRKRMLVPALFRFQRREGPERGVLVESMRFRRAEA